MDYQHIRIAYFSAEIGLSDRIPTYSGGLGVLAGDHLRAAADMGLPLCAVTLLYREGYLEQRINVRGEQEELYPPFEPAEHLELLDIRFDLNFGGRRVGIRAWRFDVKGLTGAVVPVFFLDTGLAENTEQDRRLTSRLYGGDQANRLAQEALLGFGGVRLLRELTITDIHTYHLNEGHTAFVPLALGAQFKDPAVVRRKCVFTTHTPVSAGHDRFSRTDVADLLDSLINSPNKLSSTGERVNMTELALANCRAANAVSQSHARVTRQMFPGRSIEAVTNGVHHLTWTADASQVLFDRYLPGWREQPSRLGQAKIIPADSLWQAHRDSKAQLLDYIRKSTRVALDPEMLTVGFARRAVEYKRAKLLLADTDRLIDVCGGKVQFIFAGKAHPADPVGKEIIRHIIQAAHRLAGQVPIMFLENYNMNLGGLLTAGVDVWLNTPRRPQEASGTSGMKAALNGVLNLSVPDGWWAEGCDDGVNGWAINGPVDPGDAADAACLYQLLEEEVIPRFYHHRQRWLKMMQESIITSAGFTSRRMVQDYQDLYYSTNGAMP